MVYNNSAEIGQRLEEISGDTDKDEEREILEGLQGLYEEQEQLENNENTDEYDEMLDDCGIDPKIYSASIILKRCDPIAYRCGQNDFNDGKLTEIQEEIDEKEKELKDLTK